MRDDKKEKNKSFSDYPSSVLARFKSYHSKNPNVYKEFKKLAFQMKETGKRKYSAEVIINVLRWHVDLKTNGDVFEINNDFKPLYARLLVHHHPEFDKFFEFRKVKSRGIKSEEQTLRENYGIPSRKQ